MKKVVFYSWQSDSPNSTNRGLIENALRDAAKEISGDESIDIEPVVDRDTQGVSGAPDIAATIFDKITAADIFVADISLVLNGKKRSSPNPNVLIELGYALHALGHERIVLVFNATSGRTEKLPFDLKTRRILIYKSEEGEADRSATRAGLAKDLKAALLSGFSHATPQKATTPIIEIIKGNAPSKKIELRTHLDGVLAELEKLQPPMKRDGGTVEQLISSLPATENIVAEFARLSETVVLMEDMHSAKEVFQWFGKVLTKYDPKTTGSGETWNSDGDFFKILGHELFVAFVHPFVKEGKWKELGEILRLNLRVGPTLSNPRDSHGSWTELSEHSPSLAEEGKKTNRMSLHADILKERHTKGELGQSLPMKEFTETDFFLAMFGENNARQEYHPDWYPRSILWLTDVPRFILEAEHYPTAMQICHALAISDLEELKKRLNFSDRWEYARHSPISVAEINRIGKKGGAVIVQTSDFE
jgi:hypothetical protein